MENFYLKFTENGLKVTPQRIAIYKALAHNKEHPTADVIYNKIHIDYPNISFDTVNRTLLTFAEIGLIKIIEGFGGAKRFDPDTDNHMHMHCLSCGTVVDYLSAAVKDVAVLYHNVPDGFQVTNHRVVFEGYCKNCKNKT